MQDYEKLGLFYLGKEWSTDERETSKELVLYESRHLTTHAVCVGMTGSGKTGLGIALLEEAAIDGVPVIAIDPKGDLTNLLLGFPELRPEDFAPWVDPDEAARLGESVIDYAAKTAERWTKGLADWGQDGARIGRLHQTVDLAIYTPGSSAGLPLSILRSFSAPPAGLIEQSELYRERISSAVSGLLALVGVEDDPVSSREHILLASILDIAWKAKRDLGLAELVQVVQSPSIEKVGVVDLETFFPAKDRFVLAMKLNSLLASPRFAGWLEGEGLDVGRLLTTPEGKSRLSVLSIAHLSDAERMFFVTILLNEILAWARSQPGTSSLRAVLYMDEIFGYVPPTANPPSKIPMLTLLKQSRAFGLGVVLATQNPVDLDYKGLSNAGTWFLGRLQTKRDKDRVLEGLEGASTASGRNFDRRTMDELLSGLGNRVFVMNNVHGDRPVLFQTRWTLSYLRGPLTRDQIEILMASRKKDQSAASAPVSSTPSASLGAAASSASLTRPVVPPDVPQCFIPPRVRLPVESIIYQPAVLGVAKLHYVEKRAGIDEWKSVLLAAQLNDSAGGDLWSRALPLSAQAGDLMKDPIPGARFADLPGLFARSKSYAGWAKELKNHLYREHGVTIWRHPELKAWSSASESQRDFRLRLVQLLREKRDQKVEALRKKYAPKQAALDEKVRRGRERLDREQAQATQSTWDATIAFGESVLGAFLGGRRVSKTGVAKTASKAARVLRERGEAQGAGATLIELRQGQLDLDAEFQQEVEALSATFRPEAINLETVVIAPRKADITIERVVLGWLPIKAGDSGSFEPLY